MARSAISKPASLSHDFSKSSPGLGIGSGNEAWGPANMLTSCLARLRLPMSSSSAMGVGEMSTLGGDGSPTLDDPEAGLPAD
jgi:hypothetical protein